MASIDGIVGVLTRGGLTRTNRFDVHFSTPKGVWSAGMTGRDMLMRCTSVTLPGKSYTTAERRIHGPFSKLPYESIFNDVTASFILSENLMEKDIFQQWQDVVQNKDTGNFGYYDDYITDILIIPKTVTGEISNEFTLFDAWPMSISDIQYDMSDINSFGRIDVTFAYTKWE